MPAAAHRHVRQQSQIARETDLQPFTRGACLLYSSTCNRLIGIHAGQGGQLRFETGGGRSGERAMQGAGGSEHLILSPSGTYALSSRCKLRDDEAKELADAIWALDFVGPT